MSNPAPCAELNSRCEPQSTRGCQEPRKFSMSYGKVMPFPNVVKTTEMVLDPLSSLTHPTLNSALSHYCRLHNALQMGHFSASTVLVCMTISNSQYDFKGPLRPLPHSTLLSQIHPCKMLLTSFLT